MPGNDPSPTIAFLSEVDVRQWADGVTVLATRNGSNVVLPTTASYHEDLLDFLAGRGVPAAMEMGANANANWTGAASAITAGVDANDRIWIESTAVDLTVGGNAGADRFGFDTAVATTSTGAGPFRCTAPNNWQRGVCRDGRLVITPAAAGPYDFPLDGVNTVYTQVQAPIHWLRDLGNGDPDDQAGVTNLTVLDQAACIAGGGPNAANYRGIHWGVNNVGHVYHAYTTTLSPGAWAWGATAPAIAFRNALGFTGSEAGVATGFTTITTATYPPIWAWVPSRRIQRCRRRILQRSGAIVMPDGAVAANYIGGFGGWDVTAWLDGHYSAWTDGTAKDDVRHWFDRFLATVPPGFRLNLYRHWGDPRRNIRAEEVTANQVAYTEYQTSELNRGRFRCYRDPQDEPDRTIQWVGDGSLELRAEINLRLMDYVD